MDTTSIAGTVTNYRHIADRLSIETRAFIDGNYTWSVSGATYGCVSPVDGRTIAQIARCNAHDVDLAVQSARRSFDSGSWSRMSLSDRKSTLLRFATLVEDSLVELATLESIDTGKPIRDALSFDIPSTAKTIRWYAESIDKIYGDVAPTDSNILALVTREAVGVVGCIVPWNFPAYMAAVKFAPALACGNSVILKPAEQSPLTAIKLAEIATAAGIPRGVFNVLPGFGDEVGQPIAMHMDVDCVAFTGSTAVGKLLIQAAGLSNMKRVQIEAGGKSAHIVLADVRDLDEAAASVVDNIFFNAGQICDAGSRLIVDESIKTSLMQKIVDLTSKLRLGDPLDPNVDFGAIIDDRQRDQVVAYIASGQTEGASLLYGGKIAHHVPSGFYVEPTILDGVTNDMKVAREEIFGPVLSVLTCRGLDEAIKISNCSIYGLAAGIWTSNFDDAVIASKRLRAGSVFINNYSGSDLTVPFGGFKQSGVGRDKSLKALDHYTELKTIWANVRSF
ncbi:aldehyde dehydrogenase [Aliirhizobium smilacinae]|uniref:Aldehyde dehydrogenase n=1 Tax=Aliirhizobium smilacinae TaxID=1395944 RepID=A0A5C4X8U8_9HYPH|nr:aldehyde dehydrogenase [Rhizobium smilacinae]TNM59915.1 aldehyde dehydrogenase [Rhizobium smilacinae]